MRILVLLAACGGGSATTPIDGDSAPPDVPLDVAIDAAPSTVPTDPLTFVAGKPFMMGDSYVVVPASYDPTHQTPAILFTWLHGCGGFASGDIYKLAHGDWIGLAVGGAEGDCWDVAHDGAKVLAAIATLRTHFNIAPRKLVLGGYSSGGDLTYRTGFYNADLFAGLLIENSSPFRDTGSSRAASLAAASWKINIVHLAHLQDTTYPIAGVRTETEAVKAAGFPLMRIEVDGGHYDDANAVENGHKVPGTDADLATYLLPKIDAGWLAP